MGRPPARRLPLRRASPFSGQELIDRGQRDHARASAVAAFGVLGPHDPAVQKALVSLADDRVPEVRMVAARVLGDIGPEVAGALRPYASSVPTLMSIFRRGQSLRWATSPLITSRRARFSTVPSFQERPLQVGAESSLGKIVKSKKFDASVGHDKARTRPCGSLRSSDSMPIPTRDSS